MIDNLIMHKGIAHMTIQEILHIFENYSFVDKEGHFLTKCQHFIELLEYISSMRKKEKIIGVKNERNTKRDV